MTTKTKREVKKDVAKRQYDEQLDSVNAKIHTMMLSQVGDLTPNCPRCKSDEIVRTTDRHGRLVGVKRQYYCKNCERQFVEDDARYRNVWLYFRALQMVQIRGAEAVPEAVKLLQDYGINTGQTTVMRWLRKVQLSPQSANRQPFVR